MTRTEDRLGCAEFARWDGPNVPRLWYNRADVKAYNQERLANLMLTELASLIKARHRGHGAERANSDVAHQLDTSICLARGAPVLLTWNLWTSARLVNGAVGTVVDIVYAEGTAPPDDQPIAVLVDFPDYRGPSFFHNDARKTIIPIPV